MQYLKAIFIKHSLLALVCVYFIIQFTNLTLLPIFNDESIYLDWGWISLHIPGNTYISLLDAKQPLLIWIFGVFASVFPDPLFAGRLVSVIIGSLSVIGVYFLTKKLLDKHAALFAGFLYSIVPILVFYNRQALMEASIACIGIWSGYLFLLLLEKPAIKRGILLGLLFGIGFLIKSSVIPFIISALLLGSWYSWKKQEATLLKPLLASAASFFILGYILFSNPLFWNTFASNSRYTFTLGELFRFPFASWFTNLSGYFQISFFFVTPLVFIASLYGIYLFIKRKRENTFIISLYFLIALILEIIFVKTQSQRYLVAYLPFFVIPTTYIFILLWKKKNVLYKLVVVAALLIPIIVTGMILLTPRAYILQFAKFTGYADIAYVSGWTSGEGINEVMSYLQEHSVPSAPTMVMISLYTGNPENAIDVYANKSQQLFPLRLDSSFFPDLASYQCITSDYPLYFVTRNGMLSGMDKYFTLEKSFPNPDHTYALTVFTLKKNCKGKSFSLSDTYEKYINAEEAIKAGG